MTQEATPINCANKLLLAELETARKVYQALQVDSNRSLEHIKMLEEELDRTRGLVVKKQHEIVHKSAKIVDLEEKFAETVKVLEATKVERGLMQRVTDANDMISKKLAVEQQIVEELKQVVAKTEEEREHYKTNGEAKIKSLIESQSVMWMEVASMKAKIQNADESQANSKMENNNLQKTVNALHRQIRSNEELRRTNEVRSRQTEYRTLSHSMDVSESLQKYKDESESLKESIALSQTHTTMLQRNLTEALIESDERQGTVELIINETDNKLHESRLRERTLLKENSALQLKIKLLNRKDKAREASCAKKLREFSSRSSHSFLSSTLPTSLPSPVTPYSKYEEARGYGGVGTLTQHPATAPAQSMQSSLSLPSLPGVGSQYNRPQTTVHPATQLTSSRSIDTVPSLVDSITHKAVSNVLSQMYIGAGDAEVSLHTQDVIGWNDDTGGGEGFSTVELDPANYLCKGKERMLNLYLQVVINNVTLHKALDEIGFDAPVDDSVGHTIDLSWCALTERDFSQFIGWLRSLDLSTIQYLDLRHNNLTSTSVRELCLLLLSLSDEDYCRSVPLDIDFRNNKLSVSRAVALLKKAFCDSPRRSVYILEPLQQRSTVNSDAEDVVYIYGLRPMKSQDEDHSVQSEDEQEAGVVMRINFRNNFVKAENFTGEVADNVALTSIKIDPVVLPALYSSEQMALYRERSTIGNMPVSTAGDKGKRSLASTGGYVFDAITEPEDFRVGSEDPYNGQVVPRDSLLRDPFFKAPVPED